MPSVTEHYESLLAPIYVWMAGGMDAAITRGRAEVDAVCPRPSISQWAVDLGAGFGIHAIPQADIGYSVLAIDSSGTLVSSMGVPLHLVIASSVAERGETTSLPAWRSHHVNR